MIGQTLGHYRIAAKIGAGGMGEVYRAHDEQLDRDVALKVLPAGTLADEAARKQFRKEALALARLNHPNIETVHEFGSQEGVDFLAMELIAGQTLSEKLQDGPLPEKELLRLGTQFVEGLAAAHAQGIIHRDLKPGNLMITPEGRVKILDFGLAKLARPEAGDDATVSVSMETGKVSGTVPYMSPEQLRGLPIDARSDIYAAGAVLYEMAAGGRPFPHAQRAELMGAILRDPPPRPSTVNPRVAPAIEGVILKALDKEPSQRYQSARELLVALEGSQSDRFALPATPPRTVAPSAPASGVRRPLLASAGLLAAVMLALGGWLYHARRAHALNETDTLLLADFSNTTGEPVFDDTLRQGLAAQLEQSPFLNLVSDRKIQQTLKLMRQPADAQLTPAIARDLCQRVGSKAYLSGAIAVLGRQYVLGLEAVNCQTGDTLAQLQVTADSKEHVLAALGDAATKVRTKLGESLSTVQKFDTPLQQATTSSLEALQAYSLAKRTGKTGDISLPLMQRAIQLDPDFAMAYVALGIYYDNEGDIGLAAENTRRAYELRERVSERERLYIESHYHELVTGDLEKARAAFELASQTYPRDSAPRSALSRIYTFLGLHAKALEEAQEIVRLNPSGPIGYADVALIYVNLGRLEESRAVAQQARAKNLDSPFLHYAVYETAFLQKDAAGMAQQVSWAAGKAGVEGEMLAYEADTAGYYGQVAKARELSLRAIGIAEREGDKETVAGYQAGTALREAFFGYAARGRELAAPALALSPNRDVKYGAALALALAGDSSRAQTIAQDLAQRFPQNTLVRFNYLPTIQGQLAVGRRDAAKALEYLQTAAPYELGLGTSAFASGLNPVYVRGEAYLAARQGSAAAAQFQKILDWRGAVLNAPIGALAHLGLARAYALQGDAAKARAAYQEFFTLWKDADADIPILLTAEAELAQFR